MGHPEAKKGQRQELAAPGVVQVRPAAERSVNLDDWTDEELMLAFQDDNEDAYLILVGRYKDKLMNFVYRFVGSMDDAKDILQETFLRVYIKKDLYKTIAKFSTWVYTIAGNLAKSELRRRSRRGKVSLTQRGGKNKDEDYQIPLSDSGPLPDRTTDASMKYERVQQALLQLPPAFREAVIMRDIQELAYEEISAILDLPIGTVKSRINRGRNQLQELLKDIYD